MASPRNCVVCGALGTARWTITNGGTVSVADLCGVHSAPLEAIADAAGITPPAEKVSANWGPKTNAPRIERKRSFEPLNWRPPAR